MTWEDILKNDMQRDLDLVAQWLDETKENTQELNIMWQNYLEANLYMMLSKEYIKKTNKRCII